MGKGYKTPKMGGSSGMMKQFQMLQEQLQQAQQQLAEEVVTASAGGDVVRVTMTGDQRCKEVIIAAELLKDEDVDMLQDLILTAINSALELSRQLAAERLGPLAGGLSL